MNKGKIRNYKLKLKKWKINLGMNKGIFRNY
jgi:hypothetical protein